MHLHPRNCISPPPLYPERNGQRKRIVRQTKELSTITGATYYGLSLPRMSFSPLMKNTAQFAFLKLFPSVAGNRDVVCDLPLYSTGSAIVLGLTSCSRFHWLLKRIRNVIVGELNLIFSTPLLFALVSIVKINGHIVCLGPHTTRERQ